MERPRLIIDAKGTEKEVRPLATVVIEKPPHRLGLTTFADHLTKLRRRAKERRAENLWREEVEIKIQTDREWFGVRPLSDLHIGHWGVDYDALEEILAGFLLNENLATIMLGDLGDFFTPRASPTDGFLGDVITPQEQLFALRKFFVEYQDKILAVTNDPSHNDWVYQSSGIDTYRLLVEDLNIPLVYQGGLIRLNFGAVSYDIIPFHKINKFKSSFNLTHAHKRVLELHRDGDCVLAAHIHKSSFEKAYRNGHEVVLVQCGTLKTEDPWGAKQGMLGRPQLGYPIILFNTVEKRMQVVDNLEDAEVFLAG